MRIDDRTADRQAHPQAAGLGRVEGLEEALEARRSKARTRIPHRDDYAVRPARGGADQQLSPPVADVAHRFDRIDDQVQDNLLELDSISLYERQALRELHLHRDGILHRLDTGQGNDVEDRLIDIQGILP